MKILQFILDILRGSVIGIANVIPGVSGGTMGVAMGIYDKILLAATTIFKNFKKSFKTLLPYGIGALIGILGFAKLLEFLFARFPVPTAFAFVGLILGALPMLIKEVKGGGFRFSYAAAFLIMVALVVVLPLLRGGTTEVRQLDFNILNFLLMIVLGMIAAATMVVPGVSGSMVLMLMGYYPTVLSYINNATAAIGAGNWSALGSNALMLLPFLIGCVIGIVGAAKGIAYLINHYPKMTYWGILGLVIASPFAVLYGNGFAALGIWGWIASAICLAGGFVISLFLGKE